MPFLILLIILVALFVISFVSRRFSPIPYFPSNKKDMSLIVKALKLKNGQTVLDLGAGDGIVIFEAAHEAFRKKLDTNFVAVEINPFLILFMQLRRLTHPNRKNIRILLVDLFKTSPKEYLSNKQMKNLTVFLYVSPWFLTKIVSQLKKEIRMFNLVSYFYEIEGAKGKVMKGKNKINIYFSRKLTSSWLKRKKSLF